MGQDRRDFLKRSSGALGLVAAAHLCGGCALFHKQDIQVHAPPTAETVAIPFTQYPKLREPGGFVRVEGRDGDLRIVVVRRADGTLVALSMRCTHWGCDVEWKASPGEFECPCHGSRFDPTGKVLEGPAGEPLPSYPVTEDAEGVLVHFARGA